MRAQACHFRRYEGGPWLPGVAILNGDFGFHDVMIIVDYEGKPVPKPIYNYKLKEGPLCYIDTGYMKAPKHENQ